MSIAMLLQTKTINEPSRGASYSERWLPAAAPGPGIDAPNLNGPKCRL